MGALAEARCQKTSSVAGARSVARPRARAADDLSAQGSGLCARQAKGSSNLMFIFGANNLSRQNVERGQGGTAPQPGGLMGG